MSKEKNGKEKNHLTFMFYFKILLLSVTYQETGSLAVCVYIFVFISADASEFFVRSKVTQTAKRISNASTVAQTGAIVNRVPTGSVPFAGIVTSEQGWFHGHETCTFTQGLVLRRVLPWFSILWSL